MIGFRPEQTPMSSNPPFLRPRMLIAYVDSAHASRCSRYFRRLGWEVHLAAGASEAERLISHFRPHTLIIDADLPGDGGARTAACALALLPEARMVLLASQAERNEDFGSAAIWVSRNSEMDELARAVKGRAIEAAV